MDEQAVLIGIKAVIAVLGGYTAILAALFAVIGKLWVERVLARERSALQAKIDETNRRLQANLDRGVHVDKAQFDTEFQIYKLAWSSLVDLREATLRIRPTLDYVDPNESKDERIAKRLKGFAAPFNDAQQTVEKNKPFYAPSVYRHLDDVLKLCRTEAIDAEYHERPGNDYYKEARASQAKIVEAIDSTCEAIRGRISEIRLV